VQIKHAFRLLITCAWLIAMVMAVQAGPIRTKVFK
jgi:hypothetical protein